MSVQTKRIAVAVILSCVVLISWALFMDDYVVNFERGYRYFYSDDGIVLELRLQRDELPRLRRLDGDLPRVAFLEGYRVYKGLIVGRVSHRDKVMAPTVRTSYFVIDTRSDKLYDHLSKQKWLERLRHFGITSEPTLYKPSRFDAYLGRSVPMPLPH